MEIIKTCDLCGGTDLEVVVPVHAHQSYVTGRGMLTATIGTQLCKQCGFVFLSPRMDKKELGVYYAKQNRYVRNLDELFQSEITDLYRMQINIIKKYCDNMQGRALEIGSADGYFLHLLSNEGFLVEGIEPALNYKDFCESNFSEIKINWTMLENVDLPKEFFSVCSMRHVLEHLDSPLEVLRKLNYSIEENGTMYIEVPNLARAPETICDYFHEQHLSHFTAQTAEFLCDLAGFSTELIEEWDDNPDKSGFNYPVLRIIARKNKSSAAVNKTAYPDPEISRSAIKRYFKKSEAFWDNTIRPLEIKINKWAEEGKRMALFGGGPHTADLLQLFKIPANTFLAAFDNDASKWGDKINGLPIISPQEREKYNPDIVVISSREFEKDIYQVLEPWKNSGIEVVKIYNL